MHGVGIGGGMHGHRRNAEFLASAQHAQGDFAAVCDQDFIEHRVGPADQPSFDDHQWLAELDRLAVFKQNLHDSAGA